MMKRGPNNPTRSWGGIQPLNYPSSVHEPLASFRSSEWSPAYTPPVILHPQPLAPMCLLPLQRHFVPQPSSRSLTVVPVTSPRSSGATLPRRHVVPTTPSFTLLNVLYTLCPPSSPTPTCYPIQPPTSSVAPPGAASLPSPPPPQPPPLSRSLPQRPYPIPVFPTNHHLHLSFPPHQQIARLVSLPLLLSLRSCSTAQMW